MSDRGYYAMRDAQFFWRSHACAPTPATRGSFLDQWFDACEIVLDEYRKVHPPIVSHVERR